MLARPDRVEDRRVVREHEQREDDCIPLRHERERRRERDREQERELGDPLERDVILDAPPRQQHQGVRERRGLDEALERDREDEPGRDGRADPRRDPRAHRSALDPRQQENEEERRDDEQVPFLNPLRELRREGRDDEDQPEAHGERDREQSLQRSVERAGASGEDDCRGDRDDPEVEVELGDVIDEEAEHLEQVVVGVADDAVRAEEISERACLGRAGGRRRRERRRGSRRRASGSAREPRGSAPGGRSRGRAAP